MVVLMRGKTPTQRDNQGAQSNVVPPANGFVWKELMHGPHKGKGKQEWWRGRNEGVERLEKEKEEKAATSQDRHDFILRHNFPHSQAHTHIHTYTACVQPRWRKKEKAQEARAGETSQRYNKLR
jgi:hypothetical protein